MLKTPSQFRVVGSNRIIPGNPTRQSAAVAAKAERANFISPLPGGPLNNINVTALPQGSLTFDTLLSGLVGESEASCYRFYRDIYAYDTVAGSAVDLMASMPFSSFSLDGCADNERNTAYMSAIESLNLKTLLPEMAVDNMVLGVSIVTPVYDEAKRRFVDAIAWQAEHATVTPTPLLGTDPHITIRPDSVLTRFLSADNAYFRKLRNELNAGLLQAIQGSAIELDPLATIYFPRKSFSFDHTGTSYYRRILPLYLLEKSLYRGTLIETSRRQRAMLHITVGNDHWSPTAEEINGTVGLFQQADFDPLGAIVATRDGINAQELRCLCGDTPLSADINGTTSWVKLKDVVPDKGFIPTAGTRSKSWPLEGVKVRSVGGKYKEVKAVHFNGIQTVHDYSFSGGTSTVYKLTATETHRVLTLRRSGVVALAPMYALDVASETRDPSLVVVNGSTILTDYVYKAIEGRVRFVEGSGDLTSPSYWLGTDKTGREFVLTDKQLEAVKWLKEANRVVSIRSMLAGRFKVDVKSLLKALLPSTSNSFWWVLNNGMTLAEFLGASNSKENAPVYDLSMKDAHEPFFEVNSVITKNSGGDFWKYTDITDLTLPMKMRGLGLSESFLSGDANYSSQEMVLSVFTENLKAYRDRVEQKVLYGKLFPLVAYVNGFFTKHLTEKQLTEHGALGTMQLKHTLNDDTLLDMPVIHWDKPLRPAADLQFLEVLGTLKDNNVPISIATWAAAGGLSSEDLVKEALADRELKNKMKEAGVEAPGEGGGEELARVIAGLRRGPIGILNRGEHEAEYYETTPTGQRRYVYNQNEARDKAYDRLAKALYAHHANPDLHNKTVADLNNKGGVPNLIDQ